MINIQNTLQKTLKGYVDLMKYKAQSNPTAFKKMLYLVILQDLIEWAEYKGQKKQVELLKSIESTFVMNNYEFNLQYDNIDIYRNVSTPQSIYTWSKVYTTPIENIECTIRTEGDIEGVINLIDCDAIVDSTEENSINNL